MTNQGTILDLPPIPKGMRSWGPLTIMQYYLQQWAPRDARLDEGYMVAHQVFQSDTKEMMDLAEGMELSVISKDHQQNSLGIGVFFVANQAKFEAVENEVARRHTAWEHNGSPEDVLDPVSGDLYEARPMGGLTFPRAKKALYVRLRFSLEESESGYVLSFAAWNMRGQVLYHNVLEHNHPGYLMRRATHELFGNHLVIGNEGPFLEGISHLITGRKVELCQDNPKPSWLNKPYKNLETAKEHNATLLGALEFILTYIIPLGLLVLGIVVNTGRSLMEWIYHDGNPYYLYQVMGSVIGIILSFTLARIIQRQRNVQILKSKLM